jgi:hypothetical protein
MIRVYLKIITDYVLIYVWNEDGNYPSLSHEGAVVPRVYKGGFNTVSIGVAPGCELDPATGACKTGGTPKQPLTYSTTFDGYNRKHIDGMLLIDGDFISSLGACCMPDTGNSCQANTTPENCAAQGGLFKGANTVCTTVGAGKCCPKAYGDANRDGAVDMTDFAFMQNCITTGAATSPVTVSEACSCLNWDNDTDIDSVDVEHFVACAQGPTVSVGVPAAGCLGRGW